MCCVLCAHGTLEQMPALSAQVRVEACVVGLEAVKLPGAVVACARATAPVRADAHACVYTLACCGTDGWMDLYTCQYGD